MVELTDGERESCRKGRKVQILILLEHQTRMTSSELRDALGFPKESSNLTAYTKRLEENELIESYDESKFKDPSEANYKYKYHSITDAGRELIADLGK